MKRLLLILAVIVAVQACKKHQFIDDNGGNNNPPQDTPRLNQYNILPSLTNSAITNYNNEHFVSFDTRATSLNKLFVFLPGTTGSPTFYKLIVQKASSMGYHAIGLMYPNSTDMYMASANSADNSQFGKCRQEIFDGSDQTTGVSVDQNNCIKQRLIKLLQYLQQQYPTQNWQQYLVNSEVDWSKCVVAGHSQGGGHAFYISKQVPLFRAISFSSMDWNVSLGRSADWIAQPGATPAASMYSFNSINDQLFAYNNVKAQLDELGLASPPRSIDVFPTPYSSSHQLTTSASPAISLLIPDHNITCLDQYVPKTGADVAPNFRDAWEYMLRP
jgi:hypothetical protein